MQVCLCVSGNTHVSPISVCSLNKLLQWVAVINKLSFKCHFLVEQSLFFFSFYNTPLLFRVLQRRMPGAKRNWSLHSPCSQWAVPTAKMAELKFHISPPVAQTPAALLETDWQAQSHFGSPRAGCNRHWAGLNLESKSTVCCDFKKTRPLPFRTKNSSILARYTFTALRRVLNEFKVP